MISWNFGENAVSTLNVGVLLGWLVGCPLGSWYGAGVGLNVRNTPNGSGDDVVGVSVGQAEGWPLGRLEGCEVGKDDGLPEGKLDDGTLEGCPVGALDGCDVGFILG